MSTIAERLRKAMENSNISQTELAKRTGIGKSSISTYLAGSYEPKQKNIYRMAQVLDVNEAWLMGYDAPMKRDSRSAQSFPSNVLPLPKFVKKPRLGTIACGKPILAVEQAEEFDSVPEDIDCDFTLRCKGDSMINARIYNGDTVYIRQQEEVENGQIAAVRIGDEATLKRVYYNGQRIILRACNPLYEDLEYEGEELNDIEIMGLAVAFSSMLK